MTAAALQPLDIDWIRKPVRSARSGVETLPDGRIHCWIEHETIHGVTPLMLVWWFSHLEGTINLDGKSYDRYRVWHPIDHISVKYHRRNPDGTVGVGSVIHIIEMLGANPAYLVDTLSEIMKLDEEGFEHHPRSHGVKVGEMKYSFEEVADGTRYTNSLTIGFSGIFGHVLNPLIKRFVFDNPRGEAWLKHNIEEVGNFEFFLPRLYSLENGREN